MNEKFVNFNDFANWYAGLGEMSNAEIVNYFDCELGIDVQKYVDRYVKIIEQIGCMGFYEIIIELNSNENIIVDSISSFFE